MSKEWVRVGVYFSIGVALASVVHPNSPVIPNSQAWLERALGDSNSAPTPSTIPTLSDPLLDQQIAEHTIAEAVRSFAAIEPSIPLPRDVVINPEPVLVDPHAKWMREQLLAQENMAKDILDSTSIQIAQRAQLSQSRELAKLQGQLAQKQATVASLQEALDALPSTAAAPIPDDTVTEQKEVTPAPVSPSEPEAVKADNEPVVEIKPEPRAAANPEPNLKSDAVDPEVPEDELVSVKIIKQPLDVPDVPNIGDGNTQAVPALSVTPEPTADAKTTEQPEPAGGTVIPAKPDMDLKQVVFDAVVDFIIRYEERQELRSLDKTDLTAFAQQMLFATNTATFDTAGFALLEDVFEVHELNERLMFLMYFTPEASNSSAVATHLLELKKLFRQAFERFSSQRLDVRLLPR